MTDLENVLAMLATDHVPAPDSQDTTWAKWHRSDGGCIIFRAYRSGPFGSLDVHWQEEDGGYNHLFAPREYEHIGRLSRDILALLAIGDERPSRELLRSLGKPSPATVQ